MLVASDLAEDLNRLLPGNFPDDCTYPIAPRRDPFRPSNQMHMAERHRRQFDRYRTTKETPEYIVRHQPMSAAKGCNRAARTHQASRRARARAAETDERRAHCESSTEQAPVRTRLRKQIPRRG